MLNVKMPLLHVRPHHLIGKRGEGKRRQRSSCANALITRDVELTGHLQQRRRLAFERFGIRLFAVGVLKENSVTAADCSLAIALGIEGKTDARRGVEQMSLRAADGNSRRDSALHQSIVR